MSKTTKVNGAIMINSLKGYSSNEIRNNPWFKKSAKYLVMNGRLNLQNSYWKLKENVLSSGQVISPNTRIKLIKLTSIFKRHVDINKWKSFYHILNYGKSDYDHLDVSKIVNDRLDRSDIVPSSVIRETYDLADFSRVTTSEIDYPSSSQAAALKTIERIFKKKLGTSVKKWQNHTIVENKLERLHH